MTESVNAVMDPASDGQRVTADAIRTLSAARFVREFSPWHEPAYQIAPGELVRVETLCAASGMIRQSAKADSNAELRAKVGWTAGMPMTGPIAVAGAEPGDALAVSIAAIEFDDWGWSDVAIGYGPAGELVTEAEARVFRIVDEAIDFGFGVRLPLMPMIGAIGTAPRDHALDSGIPEAHGGNLDCTLIRPGSTLYLPVNIPGALLALGDLHAAMGDGEVGTAGLEVNGSVTLRVGLVKQTTAPLPLVDTGELVATVCSAPDLDEAARKAVMAMVQWLVAETALEVNDAAMLVSLAGDLRICQIVDPLMTCRLEVPKSILTTIGISLSAIGLNPPA
ncbi:MAG: acetamidase/formamidase family protein [Thermomicrobiales bacterium]